MSVVKPFTARHAVELASVGCFRVRDPAIMKRIYEPDLDVYFVCLLDEVDRFSQAAGTGV